MFGGSPIGSGVFGSTQDASPTIWDVALSIAETEALSPAVAVTYEGLRTLAETSAFSELGPNLEVVSLILAETSGLTGSVAVTFATAETIAETSTMNRAIGASIAKSLTLAEHSGLSAAYTVSHGGVDPEFYLEWLHARRVAARKTHDVSISLDMSSKLKCGYTWNPDDYVILNLMDAL